VKGNCTQDLTKLIRAAAVMGSTSKQHGMLYRGQQQCVYCADKNVALQGVKQVVCQPSPDMTTDWYTVQETTYAAGFHSQSVWLQILVVLRLLA